MRDVGSDQQERRVYRPKTEDSEEREMGNMVQHSMAMLPKQRRQRRPQKGSKSEETWRLEEEVP